MGRFLAVLCCALLCWGVVVRSSSQCTVPSVPNTVVLMDSRYLSDDWSAVASEDGNTWSNIATTNCSQEWRYCGGNSSSSLRTQMINLNGVNGTQLTIEVYFTFNNSTSTCSQEIQFQSLLRGVPESLGTISCTDTSPQTFTYDATVPFMLVFIASFPEGDCVTVNRVRVFVTVEPCDMETINYATYPMTNHSEMANGMCVTNSAQRDGSTLMLSCMNGTFVGNTVGCECNAGFGANNATMMCTACPGGTYKRSNGSTACEACPSNSNTTDTASLMCQCNSGYRRTDPTDITAGCDECDADYYQTSGGACRSCPTNSNRALNQNATFCTCGDNRVTSSGSSTTTVAPCDGCVDTHYEVSGVCMQCPPNSMATNPMDTNCMCDIGRVTSSNSMMTTSMQCSECAANYYLTLSTCQPCPANSSRPFAMDQASCMCDSNRATSSGNETTTGDECNACIANYTLNGYECVPCPENSMRQIRNPTCTCLPGYNREGDMCIAITTPPPTTPPPTTSSPTSATTSPTEGSSIAIIAGAAAGGAAVAVLIVILLLVCVIVCRLRVNRRGFYPTYEDKASEPPTMLRYSASLRSISSQTVVPADGRVTAKENEFYV